MSDPIYDEAWRELRSRVSFLRAVERGWFLLLAIVPLGVYIGRTNQAGGWVIVIVAIAAQLILRGLADSNLKSFNCPRCGNQYLRLSLFQRAPLYEFDHNYPCQHCQLPIGATSENFDRKA
jgi:predicted RNA-binding Zn-ribbon protein involved in translation (DUF1610 family)